MHTYIYIIYILYYVPGDGVYGRLVYLRPGVASTAQHLVDAKRPVAFVADGESWASSIGLSATETLSICHWFRWVGDRCINIGTIMIYMYIIVLYLYTKILVRYSISTYIYKVHICTHVICSRFPTIKLHIRREDSAVEISILQQSPTLCCRGSPSKEILLRNGVQQSWIDNEAKIGTRFLNRLWEYWRKSCSHFPRELIKIHHLARIVQVKLVWYCWDFKDRLRLDLLQWLLLSPDILIDGVSKIFQVLQIVCDHLGHSLHYNI